MADEDESDLLNEVMGDKEPEPAKEPEPKAEDDPPNGPERDPATGRFKGKEGEPEKEPETEPDPEKEPPQQQQRHEGIPSWRLKEEADAKREALERASRFEAEARETKARIQDLERQLQQHSQKKPDPIDPFENPEGWRRQQSDEFQNALRIERLNMSEAMGRLHFGDKVVDEALDWMDKLPPHEVNSIMASRNPCAEAVSRKKRADALAEIGDDPRAYRDKVLADAMKDPEFVKSVLAQAKSDAASRPEQHVTKLPPSLNRAPSAANAKSDAGDPKGVPMSDAELLADALRR